MLILLSLLGCPLEVIVTEPLPEVIADAGVDLEVQVGVEVILDGTGSSELDVTWSFGDGTTGEGPLVRHTWTEPGNFSAVATVRAEDGRTRTDSARITVYLPAASPAPSSSSAMALDPARGELWVVETDADAVTVIDLASQRPTPLVVCDAPRSVAIDGDNAWVTCDAEDVVLQLAAATRTETKRWRMYEGAHARGVVGRDGEAFVATSGRGEAAHIFEPDLLRYLLGDDLHALALAPDGTLYGTRLRSPPNEGRVYKLPPGADDAEILTLAKDPGPDSDTQNRGVPTVLHTVVMSPDGGSLFVGGHVANNERGLARDGNELTPGLSVRAALRTIDTNTGLEDPARRKVFDNQGEVSAIAVSPRGTWLWVAHPGTGTLQRLDAFTFDVTGSILDAGRGIDALLWTSSNQLLVHAALDREVRAYNLETPSGFPELAWTARTVESEPLDAVVLEGKRLFHDARDPRIARDGYLSCAVCHPDGGDDGVTWDFTQRGEGLRNTISLLGHAGMAQGPVHWTGNFDEIQDFEIDIRSGQGGTGLLDEVHWADPQIVDPWGVQKAGLSDALDALAAYVASLDQSPASPYVSTPENEALFFASGCQICHDPDRDYTDSSLEAPLRHDVGTITPESGQRLGAPLDGFDTPTLRGAWATGPWLHDGSATTIETAIGAHELPGLNLTPQQKIQLASYVRTL